MTSNVFDRLADHYDAWFDTPRGSAIFAAEVACLRRVMPRDISAWIEVGVGSGRFAAALGVNEGVDPSPAMLQKASARGIRTIVARAEKLPYASRSIRGILLVVTLCFLREPASALRESARVLAEDGELLVGIVPAESAWGEVYRLKGRAGHPFYSAAQFYTCPEVVAMAGRAGFEPAASASTLAVAPDAPLEALPVLDGIEPGCGFVGMRFVLRRPTRPPGAGTTR